MNKYYLYDIQNNKRICEVNKVLYYSLGHRVFNKEMIKSLMSLIIFYGALEYLDDPDNRLTSLEALNSFLFDMKSYSDKKTYTIIKIRIDN